MARRLPVLSTRSGDYPITLDGTQYRVRLTWHPRAASWYLTLLTLAGEPIIAGRRVVVGVPLLGDYRDPRLPSGTFFAVDTSGEHAEAGREDFGPNERVVLWYLSADEVAAVLEAAGTGSPTPALKITVP